MLVTKQLTVAIDFYSRKKKNTMEVNGYCQLSGWVWVNDGRICIFGWTIPLTWTVDGTTDIFLKELFTET